jgi:hypothetical protein
MSAININLEWSRAYAKQAGKPAYEIRKGKIRQIGRGKQQYAPFTIAGLYLEFSQLDGSEESCVGFAEKWGLLTELAYSTGDLPSEDLSFWRAEIKKMRVYIQMLPKVVRVANSRGTFAKVGTVDVLLVPGTGPNARPIVVMEPGNLLQAMNLQLTQSVAGGAALGTCQQCGRWFEARRKDAKFCTDRCKHDFHNSKRRIGK